MDIGSFFASVATMVALVIALSELIDKLWKLNGVVAQIRSLFVGVGLGELGAGFNLGMFADTSWWGANPWYVVGALVGVMAGLTGNWTFATPIVKWVLELLKIRPKE